MADVETFAAAIWKQAGTKRDPEHPIALLHQQVSLKELSNEALDALQLFCDRLLEHEPANIGADQHDSGNPDRPALLEAPR